ncbi:sensor histidine kinase [Rheinheimera sp. WS51]|uniref:sensor histidine kinase n=1 Tax=Rheinheimera sp. WS51 TaxID=3425886 RepID=UPI003D90A3F1
MISIQKKLVRTLSISITAVVLIILLAIDIAVDTWIDNQFNRAMQAKAGMLMTLVSVDQQQIDFHFSSRFLPEFDGSAEPEYFQLWSNGTALQRSKSLDLFTTATLPFRNVKIAEPMIEEITLPDGRAGRVIYNRFMPQNNNQTQQSTSIDNNDNPSLVLAFATSAESINFVLWFIDIVFIITTISVIIFIRLFVRKAVEHGLSPLNKLNEQINNLSLTADSQPIKLDEPVQELMAVKASLNSFIKENRDLYFREKRLTSDIAHELRTPVAELINLTEVIQKFPDNELKQDYLPNVLKISKRLKDIVDNILLLHKYQHTKLSKNDVFDLNQVIQRLLSHKTDHNIQFAADESVPMLVSNLSAVESIITNLISNAITHSPANTPIFISLHSTDSNAIKLDISNTCATKLSNDDLKQLFEPLWQKDSARSASGNYGLGLSIADTFAKAINSTLTAQLHQQQITLTLLIPLKNKTT